MFSIIPIESPYADVSSVSCFDWLICETKAAASWFSACSIGDAILKTCGFILCANNIEINYYQQFIRVGILYICISPSNS